MSYRSINQSGCVRLRPYYIPIILLIMILNGCKSDCEKAAAFSESDYDSTSEALARQATLKLKCKNEIDAMKLDEKAAAERYCNYTKDCSEYDRIRREEEKEEQQAKIDALSAEIKQKCPKEPNHGLLLAKELTTDQRRECYDLVIKFNILSDLIYKSSLLKESFIYWTATTMVHGISIHLFSETPITGVVIGAPIVYAFANVNANNVFVISIDITNRSDLPVLISKDDVSFYINGRKASDSDISADFKKIDSGKNGTVVFSLTLPNGYQTYEDLLSMNLKVYFNHDSIGKARLFPTAAPLNANDDIRKSDDDAQLYWPHDAQYTSNDWLINVNGIDTFKNAKVYDDRSAMKADMKKAKIL